MKKLNKFMALGLVGVMAATTLAGCGGSSSAAAPSTPAETSGSAAAESAAPAASGAAEATASKGGNHVFMFKSVGNAFGVIMYEGFNSYMTQVGETAEEKSPAETTVAAQVQLIDEALTKGCKSISISTNGDTGFDEVFAKAQSQKVPIVSVDSAASADYRVTHNNQASTEDIGAMQVRAAVMIACGKDFDPADGDMTKGVEEALAGYTGDPINIGVLSAGIDTPVQNGWIAEMEKELAKDIYAGKVNPELDKKYGDDEATKSTQQAQAFLSENKVDVIISPTTVGIAAAAEVMKSAGSDIKVTGLGLPSEMKPYMPTSDSDNALDFVCPYMMLWDVSHLGASTAAIQMAVQNDGYTGAAGEEVKMEAWGEYRRDLQDRRRSGWRHKRSDRYPVHILQRQHGRVG
ncbi:MAG: substrate-binding domain-containing protein [Blautia sp.]